MEKQQPLSNQVDGKGERKNEGKLPVELLPASGLIAVAKVLEQGAKKYAPRNWERGMKWMICYACILRHLLKWLQGEKVDSESGLSHMAHIACNAFFLIEYEETCPELDDRPTKKGV